MVGEARFSASSFFGRQIGGDLSASFFLELDEGRESLDGAVVRGGFEGSNGSNVARRRWWQTLQRRAGLGLSGPSKIKTRSER